ncbi:MAG: hypothetical protein KIT18_00440 [Burkholderiales bacterium]|nr:hypothetical protein [Burkholderiales bacterium]
MFRLHDSEFLMRHRPALFGLMWCVAGIALLMSALQGQTIPGREDLRQASGIVDDLRTDSRYVRYGPNIDTLHLRLHGADTEYVIDSGRMNGPGPYTRASRALRRGSPVTLWYEPHPDFGNRLWQIDQQGRRLIDYRETFDHETSEQMNHWLWLLGYFVSALAVVPLLLMWHRRLRAGEAKVKDSAEGKL